MKVKGERGKLAASGVTRELEWWVQIGKDEEKLANSAAS